MLAGLNIHDVGPAMTLLSSVMSPTCYGHFTLALNTDAELQKEAAIKQAVDDSNDDERQRAEARPREEYRRFAHVKNSIQQVV